MRKLTFKTFIKRYLLDVSGQKSLSIHKLAKMSKENLRILDPLILYCLFENKMGIFFKYFDKNKYKDLKTLTKRNFLKEKFGKYSFQKIYLSYERKINAIEYDNQTKSLIRVNILKMMCDKNISKYRIYTDLKLNPGNVNDYLTNDNPKKVSLSLVKEIFDYCFNFAK